MKVLFVWDVCQFAVRIKEFLEKEQLAEVELIKEVGRPKRFTLKVMYRLVRFRPDVVHIHSWSKGVVLVKMLSRARLVMQYHGSDIRQKGIPWYVKLLVDVILVSTRDLEDYGGIYYGYPMEKSVICIT